MSSQMEEPSEEAQAFKALNSAPYAGLNTKAISDQARGFVERVAREVHQWELRSGARKNGRGEAALKALKLSVEGLLGDLVLASHGAGGWVRRPMAKKSFDEGKVGYRVFKRLVGALEATGLLEIKPGYRTLIRSHASDPGLIFNAYSTRLRGTDQLMELANQYDIYASNAAEHFSYGPPDTPLIVRAASKRDRFGTKLKGKKLKFEPTEYTKSIEASITRLNQFLLEQDIGGCAFGGFIRIFHNGDVEGFKWNKGGRIYSVGTNSYQQLTRKQRRNITINGQPIVELDLNASYLRILQALYGHPRKLKDDPYQVDGIPREIVKLFVVSTLGVKKRPKRWPKELVKTYEEETGKNLKDYPINYIRDVVFRALPVLANYENLPMDWSDLMYLESEIIIGAMLSLMDAGVPSLSVHDSLICPAGAEGLAIRYLAEHSERICGVTAAIDEPDRRHFKAPNSSTFLAKAKKKEGGQLPNS